MTDVWQYALIADYAYDRSAGNGADKSLPLAEIGFGRVAEAGANAEIIPAFRPGGEGS